MKGGQGLGTGKVTRGASRKSKRGSVCRGHIDKPRILLLFILVTKKWGRSRQTPLKELGKLGQWSDRVLLI